MSAVARRWAVVVAMVVGAASCGARTAGGEATPDPAPSPSPEAAADTTTFGTLTSPCGPNRSGVELTAGETGLTADSVTITTIADPGGAKPGLNQGVFDAMVAFARWCNDRGGISGRTVVVEQRDARLVDYKNQVLDACQDSFALVGGMGVFDDQGVDDALACGLVNVPAATAGTKSTEAERTYQPVPYDTHEFAIGSAEWVKGRFPGAADAAGAFYTSVNLVDYQNRRWVEAYRQVGFDFELRTATNINESAWGPLVVQMKNAGVRYLTLTSSFEEALPLHKEMALLGWEPDVFELDGNFYDRSYPALAKAQGIEPANTFLRMSIWPFEEADDNPATRAFLDALEAAVPGADPTLLGVYAFSAGLLFATALDAAGPNPTRAGLDEQLRAIHSWDAGGLQVPTDPGGRHGSSCFLMVQVTADGFTRAYPLADRDRDVYDNDVRPGMACPADGILTYRDAPLPAA